MSEILKYRKDLHFDRIKKIMSLSRKSHRCQGKASHSFGEGCQKYLNENPQLALEEDEVKELQKCGKCLVAKYCSKDCQKTDWKEHKKYCRHITKLAFDIKAMEEEDGIEAKCQKIMETGK